MAKKFRRGGKSPKKSGIRLSDNPVELRKCDEYNTISCVPRPVSSMFSVRITTQTAAILTASSVGAAPTYVFSLSDLDNAAGFTGLFDQYRIDCVVFKLVPMQNALGLQTNSTTINVTPYVVIDYDDNNAVSSASDAREFESCIIVPPGTSCTRQFKPRMAIAAYSGAFTSFANVADQWIDAASPAVAHYGIKLWIPAVIAGQTLLQSWTIEREYYLSFRKVHG